MAAATSMFRRNLGDADRQLLVFDKHTQDVGRNIDKLSGRLGLFVDLAATLGPALIPTTTALLPILTGLTNQLGFAAIAGGSTILAFQGVGDALKAVNEQALNPSVANLEKVHEAMAKLGPAGRDFVRELQAIRPEMQKLQDAAQAGLFPGMTEGIQSLMTRLPEAERIIGDVSDTVGDLLSRAGDSLAGPEWDQFFQTLESEGRPTLEALGESIGQVTRGLAELWIAFAPLNSDFSQGMLDASRDFADWADGLSATAGFQEFMDYLAETGPRVAETLGSLGSALLDVLEAAAPLGGPALAAITAFSNAISAIADSDLGTPILAAVAAMRAYSIATSLASKAQLRFNAAQVGGFGAAAMGAKGAGAKSWASTMAKDLGVVTTTWATAGARSERESTRMKASADRLKTSLSGVGKGAAGIAALGIASTGAADSIGMTNTASLALLGTFLAPGWGTAIGAVAGGVIDLTNANDSLNDSLAKLAAMAGKVDMDTFNKQLDDARRKVEDLEHVTGVGDWVSDTAKVFGGAVTGKGGRDAQRGDARDSMEDAERTQQRAAAWSALAAQVAAAGRAGELTSQGFELTAAGADEAKMSVEQFIVSIRGANAALTRQGTWDAFRVSVLDAKKALEESGKTLQRNGALLRGHNRAGLETRSALRGIASSALEAAGNIQNFGRRTKLLQGARKSFIDVATAAGMSRAAAKRLADQLGLVDRMHVKPTITLNVGDGINKAHQLASAIAAVRSKSVTIETVIKRRQSTTNIQIPEARGGFVTAYAYGDVANRHQPELAGPGMTRVWREPETQGEAYIPLANDDRRPRARAIAAETVSLLGGTAYFADGGINARRRRGGGGGGNDDDKHVNKFTKALRAATRALEKEKTARESLISRRSELSGTVRDQFLSDPFATQEATGNVWAAGSRPPSSDPRAILKADIAKANTFKKSLIMLKQRGLDGQALAAIASTGDVGKAQALLGLGRTGINQYESLYNQRARAAAAVGTYAGGAVYNAQITETNKELRGLRAEIKHLRRESKGHARDTGREVAKGVNKGAAAAKRNRR